MRSKFTVGLYTLGCKVSQYETEVIAERFEERGFSVQPFSRVCDAYVINTCTVTAESDRKSRQIIRRAIKKNPEAVVAVIGCYSQRSPDEVGAISGVSVVIGTDEKLAVVDLVEQFLQGNRQGQYIGSCRLEDASFERMCVKKAPRTRAYVKIEDGCESKCTYCAISAARGRVRSKQVADVIAEVEGLYKNGTREIVLTGIETGSYGRDLEDRTSLAELISLLDVRGSCERIRLGSLAPELVSEEFVERVKNAKILAPHFHLSMQSGSDKVLAAMKRRYNTAMALKTVDRLRAALPTAQFTTDMMVGFPGESEADFRSSCEFIKRAEFLDVHVFAYSKREGTEAYSFDGQIPEDVKRRRSAEMIKVKNEVRDRVLDRIVKEGHPLSAILEVYNDGLYSAHSDSYVELSVQAPSGMQGELVKVIPVSHKDGVVFGKLVD